MGEPHKFIDHYFHTIVPQFIPEVLGSVYGKINGKDIDSIGFSINVTQNAQGRLFLDARVDGVPPNMLSLFQGLNAILIPVYFGVGHAGDGQNGVNLAGGGFSIYAEVDYYAYRICSLNQI